MYARIKGSVYFARDLQKMTIKIQTAIMITSLSASLAINLLVEI
jgi:hypothetical protein